MSIKLRLVLSYIAALVIPLILSIVAALIIIAVNVGSIKGSITDFRKSGFIGNSEKKVMDDGATIFSYIQNTALNEPDQLKNTQYLSSLDQKLAVINTGIIVRQGDNIIYSSKLFNGIDISKQLQKFGLSDDERRDTKIINNRLLTLKKQDFYFTNKIPGSIFIITDLSPIGQLAKNFIISMIISVLIILILTNSVLTFFVSRSIIKPLNILKNAADQIKEGNLNFEMKPYANDEIGEVAGAFEEMRSKLKSSVEQQLQYENNRKELISNISHDLKTPITAVMGYVEGIIDGVADSQEKMNKYIKTIYTKASDIDKLIDELFLFSKLDLKKVPFNFEKVDIDEYLHDCMEELRFDLEGKGIELSYINSLSGIQVMADREKIKRVIINIIENAVKYMDKDNSEIKIYLDEKPGHVVIAIKDNGHGIHIDALPFIFERFYRADPSRNSSTGGSGLGLSIAKCIVEEHGGRIWAESIEGVGTSVFFILKRV
jgi:histidine kinase